ncbi:MAG: hypothetical protein PHQ34_01100 [Methanothrix sp.]|nr:hypothetical protein [Methanothrix sp.]
MSSFIENSIIAITLNLIASFLAVVFGLAFTRIVRNRLNERKYGGWHVIIKENDAIKVDRPISVRKAKEIIEEPADLSVFLKGIASPYDTLNCDIIEEGECLGLLIRDTVNRQFIVDLGKNPPGKQSRARPPL